MLIHFTDTEIEILERAAAYDLSTVDPEDTEDDLDFWYKVQCLERDRARLAKHLPIDVTPRLAIKLIERNDND